MPARATHAKRNRRLQQLTAAVARLAEYPRPLRLPIKLYDEGWTVGEKIVALAARLDDGTVSDTDLLGEKYAGIRWEPAVAEAEVEVNVEVKPPERPRRPDLPIPRAHRVANPFDADLPPPGRR